MRASTASSFVFAASWLGLSGLAAAQDLEGIRAQVWSGDYEGALAALEPVSDEADAPLDVILVYGDLLHQLGRLEEATALIEPHTGGRHPDPGALALLGRLLADTGQPGRALRALDEAIDLDPALYRAYLIRGLTRERMGYLTRARQDFELLVEALHAGRLTGATQVTMAAIALQHLERWDESNSAFSLAVELDPQGTESRAAWAALLLEKYRPDQAAALAEETLAINPRHPGAQVLLARARLEMGATLEEAEGLAAVALTVNPHQPEALELLGELAIIREDYERAIELLRPVLRDNRTRLESLALTAAAWFLLDDRREYGRLAREVFDLNPGHVDFFLVVADFAARALRTDAALELYRQALEIDSDNWRAHLGLGLGLSRQGQDAEGLVHIQRALESDPFNVRAFNLVRFFEHDLANYETVETDRARFRFHRDERAVLEAWVPPVVDEAWDHYRAAYGSEPPAPLAIELFPSAEAFASRSLGLSHAGPHGICFGRLITARSPSTGEFNWAEVLAHELSHAFSLTASDARVPRWIGEGLADWDTSSLRPEWRREPDIALLARLHAGTLASVADLNREFLRGDDPVAVRIAYDMSALAVRFLAERWGEEALPRMLRLFSERRRLDEVLERVTGLDVAAFDAALHEHLRAQYAPLLGSFEPLLLILPDIQAPLEETTDPGQLAERALAYLEARQLDECLSATERALALDPAQPLANYVAGVLALRERNLAEASRRFDGLIAAGHDGYSVRLQLAALARRQGLSAEALEHLQVGRTFYPEGLDSLLESADIQLRASERGAAIDLLEEAARLDSSRYETASRLLDLLVDAGRSEAAWRTCRLVNEINPFEVDAHVTCGQVAEDLGLTDYARRERQAASALQTH